MVEKANLIGLFWRSPHDSVVRLMDVDPIEDAPSTRTIDRIKTAIANDLPKCRAEWWARVGTQQVLSRRAKYQMTLIMTDGTSLAMEAEVEYNGSRENSTDHRHQPGHRGRPAPPGDGCGIIPPGAVEIELTNGAAVRASVRHEEHAIVCRADTA